MIDIQIGSEGSDQFDFQHCSVRKMNATDDEEHEGEGCVWARCSFRSPKWQTSAQMDRPHPINIPNYTIRPISNDITTDVLHSVLLTP